MAISAETSFCTRLSSNNSIIPYLGHLDVQWEGVILGGVSTRCGWNAEIRRRVVTWSLTASMMTDERLVLFQELSCGYCDLQTVARGSPESRAVPFRYQLFPCFFRVAVH